MTHQKNTVFIPYNVPSSKNGKVATKRGVFPNKTVKKYLQKIGVQKYRKNTHENYKTRPNLFEEAMQPLKHIITPDNYPVEIGFYFIRDSKRKFDFNNATQLICDLLVAHGVLEDDNMDCLIPMPMKIDGKYYHVDKDNAGVWLKVWFEGCI